MWVEWHQNLFHSANQQCCSIVDQFTSASTLDSRLSPLDSRLSTLDSMRDDQFLSHMNLEFVLLLCMAIVSLPPPLPSSSQHALRSHEYSQTKIAPVPHFVIFGFVHTDSISKIPSWLLDYLVEERRV